MMNTAGFSKNTIAIKRWLDLLEDRPASLFQYLEQDYLSDEAILNSERRLFLKVLQYSKEIYGENEKAAVFIIKLSVVIS